MRSDELDEGVAKGGLTDKSFRVEEDTGEDKSFSVEENTGEAAAAGSLTRTKLFINCSIFQSLGFNGTQNLLLVFLYLIKA